MLLFFVRCNISAVCHFPSVGEQNKRVSSGRMEKEKTFSSLLFTPCLLSVDCQRHGLILQVNKEKGNEIYTITWVYLAKFIMELLSKMWALRHLFLWKKTFYYHHHKCQGWMDGWMDVFVAVIMMSDRIPLVCMVEVPFYLLGVVESVAAGAQGLIILSESDPAQRLCLCLLAGQEGCCWAEVMLTFWTESQVCLSARLLGLSVSCRHPIHF